MYDCSESKVHHYDLGHVGANLALVNLLFVLFLFLFLLLMHTFGFLIFVQLLELVFPKARFVIITGRHAKCTTL